MEREFRDLRRNQLERTLASFQAAKNEIRPPQGWLRSIRESLGLRLQDVGQIIGQPRQRIQQLEHAEAEDKITLSNLRRVAEALDCELVYAVVPKSGTLADLVERRARAGATGDVRAVERTMALEGQAPPGVDQLIEDETKRRRKQ
jgi:predicted DNA-binding mobile mystery protein A